MSVPIRELTAPLNDELLEVLFGIGDEIALADPDTEPAAVADALPTDDEEFAAAPGDGS